MDEPRIDSKKPKKPRVKKVKAPHEFKIVRAEPGKPIVVSFK